MTAAAYRQFVDDLAGKQRLHAGRNRMLHSDGINRLGGTGLRVVTVRVRNTKNGPQYQEPGGAWSRLRVPADGA